MLSYRKIWFPELNCFIWLPISEGNPREFVIRSYTDNERSPTTQHREFFPESEDELMDYVCKTLKDPDVKRWEITTRNALSPA